MISARTLLLVTDVYGRTCFIAQEDYNNRERYPRLIPLRFKSGRRYFDMPKGVRPKGAGMIARENIARVNAL